MKRLVQYEWPTFSLTFDPESGEVTTFYSQWQFSRVMPDDTDVLHGAKLRLAPSLHKLAHELAHHMLALYHGLSSSPVTWCAAHHYEQPDEAWNEERGVNALVYATFAEAREEDLPSIDSFQDAGVDFSKIKAELHFLVSAAQLQTSCPKIQCA